MLQQIFSNIGNNTYLLYILVESFYSDPVCYFQSQQEVADILSYFMCSGICGNYFKY